MIVTRVDPSDPTQAQWRLRGSNGEWVNFNKAEMLSVNVSAGGVINLPNVNPKATLSQIFFVTTGVTFRSNSGGGGRGGNAPTLSNFTGSAVTLSSLTVWADSDLSISFTGKIVYPAK